MPQIMYKNHRFPFIEEKYRVPCYVKVNYCANDDQTIFFYMYKLVSIRLYTKKDVLVFSCIFCFNV